MAAIENGATQGITNEVNEQFETLVNIMNDLVDNNELNGWTNPNEHGCATADSEMLGEWLDSGEVGYDLAGIQIEVTTDGGRRGDPVDGTSPGTMLALSTGTSNQQMYVGQLSKLLQEATNMKKTARPQG